VIADIRPVDFPDPIGRLRPLKKSLVSAWMVPLIGCESGINFSRVKPKTNQKVWIKEVVDRLSRNSRLSTKEPIPVTPNNENILSPNVEP
jgi:hypothetical protein